MPNTTFYMLTTIKHDIIAYAGVTTTNKRKRKRTSSSSDEDGGRVQQRKLSSSSSNGVQKTQQRPSGVLLTAAYQVKSSVTVGNKGTYDYDMLINRLFRI